MFPHRKYVHTESSRWFLYYTAKKFLNLCIPRKGIAPPQSQFPHPCVYERSIFSHVQSSYSPAAQIGRPIRKEYIIANRTMNLGIGTVAVQLFLSWEYLFRIFGIVSLQCTVDILLLLRTGARGAQ
jgi:hypothetical protein